MRALIDIVDVMAKEDNSVKIKYIEGQIVKNASELNKLELKLKDYEKSQNVYAIDKEMQATMSGFYALKLQYEKDRIQREALAKQYEIRVNRLEESNPLAVDKVSFVSDPVLQNIKSKMSEVQLEIFRNQEILKPDNPLLKQNKLKLESLTEQLKNYTSSLQNNALNDIIFNLTSADAMLAAEKQLIENYEKSFAPLPERKLQFTRMVRDQKIYEQIYIYLKQELEKAKLDSENTVVTSRILDEAEAPSARFAPRVKLAVMIAGASGLLLGCVLAFVIDVLLRLKTAKPAS
jgi:uncharacterized protein involved in exopolysaccharide biosynthesis